MMRMGLEGVTVLRPSYTAQTRRQDEQEDEQQQQEQQEEEKEEELDKRLQTCFARHGDTSAALGTRPSPAGSAAKASSHDQHHALAALDPPSPPAPFLPHRRVILCAGSTTMQQK